MSDDQNELRRDDPFSPGRPLFPRMKEHINMTQEDQYGEILKRLREQEVWQKTLNTQVSRLEAAIKGDFEIGHTGLAQQLTNTRKELVKLKDEELEQIKKEMIGMEKREAKRSGFFGAVGVGIGAAITVFFQWIMSLS